MFEEWIRAMNIRVLISWTSASGQVCVTCRVERVRKECISAGASAQMIVGV